MSEKCPECGHLEAYSKEMQVCCIAHNSVDEDDRISTLYVVAKCRRRVHYSLHCACPFSLRHIHLPDPVSSNSVSRANTAGVSTTERYYVSRQSRCRQGFLQSLNLNVITLHVDTCTAEECHNTESAENAGGGRHCRFAHGQRIFW